MTNLGSKRISRQQAACGCLMPLVLDPDLRDQISGSFLSANIFGLVFGHSTVVLTTVIFNCQLRLISRLRHEIKNNKVTAFMIQNSGVRSHGFAQRSDADGRKHGSGNVTQYQLAQAAAAGRSWWLAAFTRAITAWSIGCPVGHWPKLHFTQACPYSVWLVTSLCESVWTGHEITCTSCLFTLSMPKSLIPPSLILAWCCFLPA